MTKISTVYKQGDRVAHGGKNGSVIKYSRAVGRNAAVCSVVWDEDETITTVWVDDLTPEGAK